jgi:multiple sugar transport system permease protein
MNVKRAPTKRRARKTLADVITYTILIVSSLVMTYPLLFGLLGSISTQEDYLRTPWLPIPSAPSLRYYAAVLTSQRFEVLQWVGNTLLRAGWYILIPGTLAVLIGYALSKLRFRGREAVFLYLLGSLVLPSIVFNIATFVMMVRFPLVGGNDILGQGGTGFLNQWPALLLPGLVNAYFIFLFRQTFVTIPSDFEEAARVDGAGTLRCLFTIYLPMLKPVLTVFVIFQFVAMWNDYVWPLLVSRDNEAIWVLSVAFQFLTGTGNLTGLPSTVNFSPFGLAAAMIATLPLVVLYLLLQRYFVEGVQGFAIKG